MNDSAGNPAIGVIVLFIMLAVYLLPTIIAVKHKNKNLTPITLLNIFLGWTFIGWVLALIWATLADEKGNPSHEHKDAAS